MPAGPAALHVPGQVPAYADDSLPVLTSALTDDKAMAEPAMAAVLDSTPAPREPRRAWQTVASLLVVAAAAMGVWYVAPIPHSTVKPGGFVTAPELPAAMNVRSAPMAPANGVGVGKAPAPAVAPIEPSLQREVEQAAGPTAPKAAHAAKARSRPRQSPEEAEVTVPQPVRPDVSSRSPSPARPCTPTVAALGLCTAPSVESKE